jgi:hypothetical protein
MSDDEFDESADIDLDDEDLDEDLEDEDEVLGDEDDDLDVDDLDDQEADPIVVPVAKPVDDDSSDDEDEDDEGMDLEEELHPDDVEDPLDVLLQERTASATLEDDEDGDDEEVDLEERGDGPTRIIPRRPGEFLCSSCFLVLPRHQLADEAKMLCKDCA